MKFGMDSINILVTLIGSLLASTGFWTFMSKHVGNNGVNKKQNNMLIGLAHDRIIELGMKYLEIGYITADEFENLYKYLYMPYKELGGNGTAEKMINDIKKLPMKK